ncbi:hypothetical protein DFR28_10889 [Arenicella xantha]|uniref:Uncharacterized protein n=2 Tax=Arenicella xantha TaxID=644221 RepID=A0A395JI11_9GAMM|nr:hypothetical protein DFR28_10889 [Arenicella xantha]
MGKLENLDEVSAAVLPAKVLVLLSKYAQTMRKHTGLVIKISSMNVFKHVHNTHKLTQHPEVTALHKALLNEVSQHLADGTMQTVSQRLSANPKARKSANSSKHTLDRQSLLLQDNTQRSGEHSMSQHLD